MAPEGRAWRFTAEDIDPLLRGTEIMGTGGGGSAAFGRAIMENDLRRGRSYDIVALDHVPDDALVISGGIMGSVKVLDRFTPEEIVDQWETQFEPILALRAMERHLGRSIDFLVPFELGGLNTPVILSLAARVGIPVIDGDGVGRAAPETQMTSFIGHGISLTPMPLVDWKGNTVIVEGAVSPFFPDEVGRFVVTRAGGLGANAHYPMSGRQAKEAVLPGTISFSRRLGEELLTIRGATAAAEKVAERLGGQRAFVGTVASLREEDAMGFLVQTAQVDGLDEFRGQKLDVVMKNEFMMAVKDGVTGCVFPDLILLLGSHGRGVMSSELAVGDEVHIVIAPCHPRLREAATTEVGRKALGAARFGRPETTYEPVETLSAAWGLTWPKH